MNMSTSKLLALTAVASLLGCASYRPMVLPASIYDPFVYEQDLSMCQDYARRISPGGAAITGAVIGGLVGAAFGVAIGHEDFARRSMRFGAAQGAVNGAASAADAQVNVIRRCMSAQGYAVLY